MKNHLFIAVLILLALSCETTKKESTSQPKDEYPEGFPYGNVPREKPNTPMSAAFNRIYDGSYAGLECQSNELFSTFKYTPLKGLDYGKKDGRISRRDASKVIKTNGKYYVGIRTGIPQRHRMLRQEMIRFLLGTGIWQRYGMPPVKMGLLGKNRE